MKGYIYKIFDKDDNNLVYYGSSTNKCFIDRIGQHRRQQNTTSSIIINRNNYGYEKVEEIEFEDKQELYRRERYYIENNICVNKCIPGKTMEEKKAEAINRVNIWYKENKKEMLEKRRTTNITCECGAVVRIYGLREHKQTKKHKNKIYNIIK
tara:strand:- start:14 stop:472 length:459 start_codon:yes stop_codon:yes gene_type:complete